MDGELGEVERPPGDQERVLNGKPKKGGKEYYRNFVELEWGYNKAKDPVSNALTIRFKPTDDILLLRSEVPTYIDTPRIMAKPEAKALERGGLLAFGEQVRRLSESMDTPEERKQKRMGLKPKQAAKMATVNRLKRGAKFKGRESRAVVQVVSRRKEAPLPPVEEVEDDDDMRSILGASSDEEEEPEPEVEQEAPAPPPPPVKKFPGVWNPPELVRRDAARVLPPAPMLLAGAAVQLVPKV